MVFEQRTKQTNFAAINVKFLFILIFLICLSNFVLSGKNQWKKQNKLEEETEQKTLWNIPPKQKVIDERHRCPEKEGKKRTEKATEENDDERIELMNIFKNFIRNESKNKRTEKLKMRINSLKLVLERTIGGILAFARKIGTKNEQKGEFIEEIEKWENKRREIEEKAGQKKMDGKMNNWLMWICLMYELGTKMVEGMAKHAAAQKGSLMVEAWRKYAKEKHIADILKAETVTCNNLIGIMQTMARLTNPPRIFPIIGLTLMELLAKYESFRHFFCHEVLKGDEMKVSLNHLTNGKYLTLLENEFPEVLRIDILTKKSVVYRVQQMLMNRSNSELYINNFVLFVTALLVDQMARLHSQFGATARPKASPALRLLADKANAAAEDALRHFGSTSQLCVMNTILIFVWEVNIEKKAENVTKKAVKKLGTSECEEWRVQRQAMAEAMGTRLGTLITAAIAELLMIDKTKVQSALKYPGAQIRLLRLAGTVKRTDQLTEHFDLAQLFVNNALTNDDDFWVHYLQAMCRADKIERKSHKFGADLAAFVRWLRQKLTVERRLNSHFVLIRNYISDQIYNPIFDAEETTLMGGEEFLEKLFWGTKKMVEKLKGTEKKSENLFERWKLIAEEKKEAEKAKNGEFEAKKRWVGQIHAEEMRKLLKNGKLSQLSEVLNVFGSKTIREGLLQFFDVNEIDELFKDFKLKENKKTQIENLEDYFSEDEESEEIEEEFEQSEEELDEEDEEGEDGREDEFEGDEAPKKQKEIVAPENAKECAKRMSDRKEGEILECDQTEDNALADHRQNEWRSAVPSPSSANVSAFSVLDFDLLSLTDHFVNLFCQMDDDPSRLSKIGLMRNTEMRAIIFYYRHCVDGLFNFGQLKWENGIFNERIGTYKKKWDKIKTIGRENEGKLEQKMCQIYQFVYQMVKDDKLMRMNGKWGRNLAENVAQFGEDTFEQISNGRLILLADRPRQWHRIDCANRSEADELVNEVRLHCPQLMEGVHLLALAHLIGKSGKMRDTLANGTEENILWMKHKISSTVSHRVLNKLEMVHPEVMHYEHLSISHLLVLLLRQLEFKSGTLAAENAGVRISSPFLLGAINEIEHNLRENDSTKTAEEKTIGEVLLMIIGREKVKFYAQLAKANETNLLLRKAFCPLFMFFILAESIDKGQLKVGKADVMREWNGRKCEEEEVVKSAISHFAAVFSANLSKVLDENPEHFQSLRAKIEGVPGAKTRLFKLLKINSEETVRELLPDITDENWKVKALWMDEGKTNGEKKVLFSDDNLLIRHYVDLFVASNSMKWLNAKLKLDLFVFFRWIDAKISKTIEIGNHSTDARRFATFWERKKLLLCQFYDQLFDENEDEMPNIKIFQMNFLNELNLFFEKILKNAKKVGKGTEKEMRKIIEKSQRKYEESKRKGTNEDKLGDLEEQLMEKHVETINGLIKRDKQFKKIMENVKEAEIVGKLSKHLGKETNLEILKRIEFNGIGKKLEENFEKRKEETEVKVKREKKKAKQKKQKKAAEEKEEKEGENTVIGEEREEGTNTVEKDTVGKESDQKEGKENEERKEEKAGKDKENTVGEEREGGPNTVENVTVEKGSDQKEGKENEEREEEKVGAYSEGITEIGENNLVENNRKMKMREFGDGKFLAAKYDEYLEIINKGQQQNEQHTEEMGKSIALLNIGVLSNEISNRLEAKEWEANGSQRKSIGEQWERLKRTEYSQAEREGKEEKHLEKICQIIGEIVGAMGENREKGGAKCDQIIGQLHQRKLGEAIKEGKVKNWEEMGESSKKMALLNLYNGTMAEKKSETILEKFERNLEFLKRAGAQRKLDQKLFYEYKNNANLTTIAEEKDKCQFKENNSQLFQTEKFQELNSAEEKKRKFRETEKVKKEIKLKNGQKNGREMAEIKQIFDEWSDAAHFQFPSLFFLRDTHSKFATICILPEEFEEKLIFGESNCDEKTEQRADKCSDNSLFCALCKGINLIFIQKHPKSQFSNIPSILIGLSQMQIDVKFLEIPKFARIPRKNFSAKQTEIFLMKFGQIIHKLEDNDHFDEGVYWHEIKTRNEMRKKYENGKGTENKAYENERRQFDKITELFHQRRRKALDERAEVKQRKEALFILADHATSLKVLQFILPENNYLAILERFELADAFGTKTLEKFRTILAYLEKWAKNNQILSNELGYFNGQMLLLMLSKVFLLFPNSSLPFLIDRFFLIFSNWNWPMPVQLAEISDKKFGGFLSWSPYREWFWRRQFAWENFGKEAKKNIRMELAMAVITPTFPERNVAEKVNNSSAKVLKNELKKALAKIRNKKDENAIIGPIRMSKFSEKFENFVVFKCFGTSFNVKNFCGFVGQRLRYELLEFVENPLAFWVDFCHVFPKAIALSKCQTDGSKICELAWIVGIQMAPNQKANGTFKRKLNAKLSKKLEAKIQGDFEKGSFHNIQLKAEMASGETVRNWIAKEEREENEEE